MVVGCWLLVVGERLCRRSSPRTNSQSPTTSLSYGSRWRAVNAHTRPLRFARIKNVDSEPYARIELAGSVLDNRIEATRAIVRCELTNRVGLAGFEPATSRLEIDNPLPSARRACARLTKCGEAWCSTVLSYRPIHDPSTARRGSGRGPHGGSRVSSVRCTMPRRPATDVFKLIHSLTVTCQTANIMSS